MITKEEYKRRKSEYLKKRAKDGDDWGEWSMQEQSPDDIVFRTLVTCEKENNNIAMCFTYICESNRIPTETLDQMIFIMSGFFSYEKWNLDDDNVKEVLSIICDNDPLKRILKVACVFDYPYPVIQKK